MTDTITDTRSTKQRWDRAIRNARKAGVTVKVNVRVCCYSCTTPTMLDMTDEEAKTEPYAWIIGTQGQAVRFDRVTGDPRPETHDVPHFKHGNGAGRALADAFRAEGFEVEWDGSDARAVGVRLRAA